MTKVTQQQFPVIPPDYDHEIEWFGTLEQAQLYAAATGGSVSGHQSIDVPVWLALKELSIRGLHNNTKP